MDKEQFEIWAMEYLSEKLDEQGSTAFEEFLGKHPEFQENFESVSDAWSRMDDFAFPEPSVAMDEKFYEVLYAEMEKEKAKPAAWMTNLRDYFGFLFKPQLAYGLLILIAGFGLGQYMSSGEDGQNAKGALTGTEETQEVREQLVLTLLEQPSANKRLQGVNEAVKFKEADDKVIKALLKTLNNDDNVNVRLAAIESLVNYLDNPIVREGLVASIVQQDSPIVQVTLADLMVSLQEKKSIEPFKKLMRTSELNGAVKQKLEKSIREII